MSCTGIFFRIKHRECLHRSSCPEQLSCTITIHGSMVMKHSGLVAVLFLFTAGLVLASGCISSSPPVTLSPTPTPSFPTAVMTTSPSALQVCLTDDDCVPAECCHPASCINKANKGVCTLLCTMSCEGPIDCGAGRCGCVNGKCSVVATPLTQENTSCCGSLP